MTVTAPVCTQASAIVARECPTRTHRTVALIAAVSAVVISVADVDDGPAHSVIASILSSVYARTVQFVAQVSTVIDSVTLLVIRHTPVDGPALERRPRTRLTVLLVASIEAVSDAVAAAMLRYAEFPVSREPVHYLIAAASCRAGKLVSVASRTVEFVAEVETVVIAVTAESLRQTASAGGALECIWRACSQR